MEGKITNQIQTLIPPDDPITFARSYQLEALQKAMKENTIAFLETGSGKTLIAIMLIRTHAYLLRKPSQFIAIFLVPTVVLVTQQAEAVEFYTDLKVGKYWGDMGVDYWDALTWKNELDKYEVFVMTPQILLDALRHSFFKIDDIKLLIFDECHNARGRTPYACILREFYHPQLRSNSTQLPRIFGMTASPIKAKGSSSSNIYAKQILELERLMNSKVYTVANESVLAEFIPFSTLKLKSYKHVDPPAFGTLVNHLNRLKMKHTQHLKEENLEDTVEDSAVKKIARLFATFMFCLTDLGVWLAFKAAGSLMCTETDIFWPQNGGIVERILRNICEDVAKVFSAYIPSGSQWQIGNNISVDFDAGFVSAKVNCLIESLMEYRTIKDLRCIIFVERVITAVVLQSLLGRVWELSSWNTTYMAGNRSGLQLQTRKKQIEIIDAFRKGMVNIIVATSILEEGLDVQSCNLVIRFDPSATVCSFIQSRGRARMQGSDYLLIVRSGDASALSKVNNYLASGDIMREESLRYSSQPCEPLEIEWYDEEYYRVETTRAVVTLSSSVALIYFYCSRLPSDGYFRPAPMFLIDKDSKFCTLHLPKSCPIQTVRVEGEKDMLKKIACLEACRELHKAGALTDNLLPLLVEEDVDAQDSGDISYDSEQVKCYPGELVSHWPSSSVELYHCYSIGLKRNFDYDVPFRDISLLVRCSMESDFENMEFELEIDRGSVSVNVVYAGTISLSSEQVLMARKFQITILRVLIDHNLNKLMDALDGLHQKDTLPRINYLLLPSIGCNQRSSIIDWDCVKPSIFLCTTSHSPEHFWSCHRDYCSSKSNGHYMQTKDGVVCRCMLVNSLVITPHNGYIYCVTGIIDDLDGTSFMRSKGKDALTYKKYYQSRHDINLHYEDASLLSARHIFTVRNWLQRCKHHKEKDWSNAHVELPPELCAIIMSPLSISTLYSFSLVPSIMHRVESTLLALSLKKLQLNHCMQNVIVPTKKILEAITTKKCQEEFCLESLETLGDSFLKYAASQQLFRTNKNHHEGLLSAKKEKMVSNKALRKLGCDRKLQGFIRYECFNPNQWVIPGDYSVSYMLDEMLLLPSKNIYAIGTRPMKSKVVADVVEALIGAYLSTGSELAALLFMDWVGIKVEFDNNVPNERRLVQPERYVNIRKLESLLKYSFRDPSLLVEALTHGSYQLPEIPGCYQRLEFLGDSVLDYLLTVHLYDNYPGISPGLLTDLRSSSVNNDCYAHAAVKAGLHKDILHASSELHRQIAFFVNEFEQLSLKSTFGWESETSLPKVLGDIIESLAGAILVDSGYDKDIVWECIRPLLEPLVTLDTVKLHPVRELTELCQQNSWEIKVSKSDINGITVEVEANGITYHHTCTEANKKTAKKLAAKVVLKSLKQAFIPPTKR